MKRLPVRSIRLDHLLFAGKYRAYYQRMPRLSPRYLTLGAETILVLDGYHVFPRVTKAEYARVPQARYQFAKKPVYNTYCLEVSPGLWHPMTVGFSDADFSAKFFRSSTADIAAFRNRLLRIACDIQKYNLNGDAAQLEDAAKAVEEKRLEAERAESLRLRIAANAELSLNKSREDFIANLCIPVADFERLLKHHEVSIHPRTLHALRRVVVSISPTRAFIQSGSRSAAILECARRLRDTIQDAVKDAEIEATMSPQDRDAVNHLFGIEAGASA